MDATVVITTRNRREDLREALPTVLAQTASVEVLVVDDASEDGTAEMVRSEFPGVRLERREEARGLIVRRNEAARLASAPIVFSMDDDARLPHERIVEQTLADLDHPRIGAVAVPYTDRFPDGDVPRQRAPDAGGRWIVSTYTGTAHALRRELFLALGGYREELQHMCEEPDYCLRMLDAGYVVRIGRAEPMHHLLSTRDQRRNIVLGRRNEVLHGLNNVPMPYMPVRLAKVVAESALLAGRWREPRAVAEGTVAGFRGCSARLRSRSAVARSTYALDHRLRTRGPLRLEEIGPELPPMRV